MFDKHWFAFIRFVFKLEKLEKYGTSKNYRVIYKSKSFCLNVGKIYIYLNILTMIDNPIENITIQCKEIKFPFGTENFKRLTWSIFEYTWNLKYITN